MTVGLLLSVEGGSPFFHIAKHRRLPSYRLSVAFEGKSKPACYERHQRLHSGEAGMSAD